MLVETFAYEFESDLTLREMLARLRAATPWKWFFRENDRWGDYLSGAARRVDSEREYVPACKGTVKVIEIGDGKFAFNILYKSTLPDAEQDFDGLHREICDRVLPELHARNVQRVADYE